MSEEKEFTEFLKKLGKCNWDYVNCNNMKDYKKGKAQVDELEKTAMSKGARYKEMFDRHMAQGQKKLTAA